MSMELITIISVGATMLSVGVALAALIITGQHGLRREMQGQRKDIDGLREENRAEFKAVREENQAEFKAIREENQAEFKAVREQMQAHREENQAEFKVVREDLGDLRERTARVEGMLEGLLREPFIGRRTAPAEAVAEDPGPYDKR